MEYLHSIHLSDEPQYMSFCKILVFVEEVSFYSAKAGEGF